MNINDERKAVILGQIATIEALIMGYKLYTAKTDVNTTEIVNGLEAQITQLKSML